jgi:heme/copper-type cytochrome/quinol oxidase subunit 2
MSLGALVLMKDRAIDFALGSIFVILSFVAFVLVEGVLVWRLLRLNKRPKDTHDLARERDSDSIEHGAVTARAIGQPPQAVPSVTEETTRAFEPSYRENERQ